MESTYTLIPGVMVTPLKQIHHPSGDIFHALKSEESSFLTFGEAYFSTVNNNVTKGWKKHFKMTMNLIVPHGEVQFYFYNEAQSQISSINVGESNYVRLTIEPGIWVAFKGISVEKNIVLNIASIEHDPTESINIDLSNFPIAN